MKKVFAIGELLIDFVGSPATGDLQTATEFMKKAGGAPANVAAAVSRLGGDAEFVGAVGGDPFGDFLKRTLSEVGVGTRYLQRAPEFTTLAFVSIAEDGERDFVFSRGADACLFADHALRKEFKDQVVHFGSATAFLKGQLQKTYLQYLEMAEKEGALICFDPNFRKDLWKTELESFRKQSLEFISRAHIAKFSLEEAELLSGRQGLEQVSEAIGNMGLKVFVITLGAEGTWLYQDGAGEVIASVPVKPVDTTGAGDAFVGCLLWQFSKAGVTPGRFPDRQTLRSMISVANKAGAFTTTRFGAIAALPDAKVLGVF